MGQDVDSVWGKSELVDRTRNGEVGRLDAVGSEGGSKREQCSGDPRGVGRDGSDENVQVTGASNNSMYGKRVGPDDQEVYVFVDERTDHVDEVLVQLWCVSHEEDG